MCTTYFGIVEDYSKIWLHLCDWFFNFSQENGCLAYESGVIAISQNLLAHGGTHQNVMCTTSSNIWPKKCVHIYDQFCTFC